MDNESEEFEFRLRAEQESGAPKPTAVPKSPALSAIDSLKGRDFNKGLEGVGEAGLNLVSGAVAQPVAGLRGIYDLASGQGAEKAAKDVQSTSQALTYQPRTQAGKNTQAIIAAPFEKLDQAADYLGEKAASITGSPAVGAGVKTLVDAAPLALGKIPGAARAIGSSDIAQGAVQVTKGVADRIATKGEAAAAVKRAQESPKNLKIATARGIGLKIPPTEGGGPVGKVLEGVSGKIQTEMAFSRANAKVINKTAAKDIGLNDKQPLTEGNIERLKQKEFKTYDRVKNVGRITADEEFRQELEKVKERTEQAQEDYPGDTNEKIDKEIAKFNRPGADSSSMLEKVKSLRQRAGKNMQSADAETFELGIAQKKIATALENQIDRHVAVTDPGLIGDFRASRQRLAKIYNVEDALGPNGNLSAAVLKRQYDRGVPLSGGLKSIAESYAEFPKVMRYVDNLGGHAPFSALDYLVGGVEAVANPSSVARLAGTLALRPIARAAIGTDLYQRSAIKPRPAQPGPIGRTARRIAGPKTKPKVRLNTLGQYEPTGERVPATLGDLQ